MLKISTIPRGARSQSWFGQTDLHDYTIQSDVCGATRNGRLPDVGVIGQRYSMVLMGDSQKIEIRTWPAHDYRMRKSIPFTWKPETWYTMKFESANKDGKVVLRGKVWPRRRKRTGSMDDRSDRSQSASEPDGKPRHLRRRADHGNLLRQYPGDEKREVSARSKTLVPASWSAHVALSSCSARRCGSHLFGDFIRLRPIGHCGSASRRLAPAVAAATATAATVPAGDPTLRSDGAGRGGNLQPQGQAARLAACGAAGRRATTRPKAKTSRSSGTPKRRQHQRWTAKLGSQTYGNPVIANGKVFVGTNNGAGYIKRYPRLRRPGLPALLRREDGQVPLAALQSQAAAGARERLAAAGRLQHALLRRRPVVVRDQPGRGRVPRRERLLRRQERRPLHGRAEREQRRSRRDLALRHDGPDGRRAAQHVQLLDLLRGRRALRLHVQRRRLRSPQYPGAERPQLLRDGPQHGQGAVDRQVARPQHPARPMVVAGVRRARRTAAGRLRRRRRLALQLRSGRRRPGARQAAVEVRLQSEGRASTRSTAARPATTSSPRR